MSVANNDDKWTKWWWLGLSGFQTWTFEEHKVRIALGITTIVAFLIIHFPLATLLEFGIEPHYAADLSGVVSLVLAFFAARPIATIIFPNALRKADGNSQTRLRGRAARSTKQSSSTVRGTCSRGARPPPNMETLGLAGPPVLLATLCVLFVPLVPVVLCLDTQVRQRAGDAVWESVSGHYRPFTGLVLPIG
jgi:hypothetical protein